MRTILTHSQVTRMFDGCTVESQWQRFHEAEEWTSLHHAKVSLFLWFSRDTKPIRHMQTCSALVLRFRHCSAPIHAMEMVCAKNFRRTSPHYRHHSHKRVNVSAAVLFGAVRLSIFCGWIVSLVVCTYKYLRISVHILALFLYIPTFIIPWWSQLSYFFGRFGWFDRCQGACEAERRRPLRSAARRFSTVVGAMPSACDRNWLRFQEIARICGESFVTGHGKGFPEQFTKNQGDESVAGDFKSLPDWKWKDRTSSKL